MTLDDVRLLSDYAAKHPPLRVLVYGVAVALGIKFPEQAKTKNRYMTAEEARVLMAQTGGRIEGVLRHGG